MKQYTLTAVVLWMISPYMHAGIINSLKASQNKIVNLKQNVKGYVNSQDLKIRCKQCNFRCRSCDKV